MTSGEIVVGIDFGTTFSGVSWAVNAGTRTVRLINDWPDPISAIANAEKVPSVISYANGRPDQFGYSVPIAKESVKWFKLLLDPTHSYASTEEAIAVQSRLEKSYQTAEDVAADYLRLIWEYTKADICRLKGENWESAYNIKVVLTVPAIWAPAAKDRTERFAKAAGIPGSIMLVSEPEAAAMAVLKDKDEEEKNLQPGDCFVVCDAGGGTVVSSVGMQNVRLLISAKDLISYKILTVDPLRVEECAVGDGELCGSVFLDMAFEKHIKTVVGDEQYAKLKDRAKKKMIKEFETGVKCSYTGEEKEYFVDLSGVEDNPEYHINDETITLKSNMVRTIFDHIIGKILILVDNQIDEVRAKDLTVKAILLVGGFGANKYLYTRLTDAHQNDGVKVLQVNGARSSICRGATLWGLDSSRRPNDIIMPRMVSARLARYSYGICWDRTFDSTRHRLEDRVVRLDGAVRARNQMEWLIKKGDKIEENQIISLNICNIIQGVGFKSAMMSSVSDFAQQLYYCAADVPPPRNGINVKQLCAVSYGIEHSKLRKETKRTGIDKVKFRKPTFELQILPGSATIKFTVLYKGTQVAYTEAEYKENS
ncbi:hypothetical protein Vi05172_g9924 [Venturia inaequalis]|nr:hypothetical protein Vi05172_g9924 [Venturia inaequalis]